MKNTKIEWADHTLNFWWGCEKVSDACKFCYAEAIDKLFGGRHDGGKRHWGKGAPRWIRYQRALEETAEIAAAARKSRSKKRPRVFVNSMSDTFEDNPLLDETRCKMLCMFEVFPYVDFLLLTKRPENVRRMVPMTWLCGRWPRNVWIGTTVENQEMADLRIPQLIEIPAAVRFLSCEPLLGPVNLNDVPWTHGAMAWKGWRGVLRVENEPDDFVYWSQREAIQWVIAGGESGPRARACDPNWVRALRSQCVAARVPFHFKQWGGVRKHETGRLLDGVEWNEFPEPIYEKQNSCNLSSRRF